MPCRSRLAGDPHHGQGLSYRNKEPHGPTFTSLFLDKLFI